MSRREVMVEFVRLLREERKYWLLPLVVVLMLVGLLLVLVQGSALAPFIYTLF